mmetsp:Transcript_2954/g.8081  ORF Transcript_2954/g.8081 Transcript_2954/m.8081 type:complete len:93 (+) Transcript_2954:1926-2204(+)
MATLCFDFDECVEINTNVPEDGCSQTSSTLFSTRAAGQRAWQLAGSETNSDTRTKLSRPIHRLHPRLLWNSVRTFREEMVSSRDYDSIGGTS